MREPFRAKLILMVKGSFDSDHIKFEKCYFIKHFLETFLLMEPSGKYNAFFQDTFIQTLGIHYQSKSVPEYHFQGTLFKQISQIFKREQAKYARLLPTESISALNNVLFAKYVMSNIDDIIEDPQSGLLALIREGNHAGIREMYTLFSMCEGGSRVLSEKLKGAVIALGRELTSQALSPEKYISELVAMVRKFNDVVKCGFDQHCDFEGAVNEGFESFMRGFRDSSLFLVRYINDLLTKDAKAVVSGKEFEESVNALRTVFFHVHDKDEFEFLYRKFAMARLLTRRDVHAEYEQKVLKMLEGECGSLYVSKMEVMFKDMDRSRDFDAKFGEECRKNGVALPFELSVSLLTVGVWTLKLDEIKLPKVVLDTCHMYEEYYVKENFRQQLTWYNNLALADVQVTISPTSAYLITLNASQFVVLYNILCSEQVPTLRHVVESTGLSLDEVKKILFVFHRIRLITSRSVSDESTRAISSVADFGTMEGADDIKFDLSKKFKYKSKMLNLSTVKDLSGGGGNKRNPNNKKRLESGSENGNREEGSAAKHVKNDKIVLSVNTAIVKTLKSVKEESTFASLSEAVTKSVPDASTDVVKLCLKQLIAKGFVRKNGDRFEYCKED